MSWAYGKYEGRVNVYTVLVGILKEKDHSYALRVQGRIILEWILPRMEWRGL